MSNASSVDTTKTFTSHQGMVDRVKSPPTVLTLLVHRSNMLLEKDVSAPEAIQGLAGMVVQPSTSDMVIHMDNMFSFFQVELGVFRDQLSDNFPTRVSRPTLL